MGPFVDAEQHRFSWFISLSATLTVPQRQHTRPCNQPSAYFALKDSNEEIKNKSKGCSESVLFVKIGAIQFSNLLIIFILYFFTQGQKKHHSCTLYHQRPWYTILPEDARKELQIAVLVTNRIRRKTRSLGCGEVAETMQTLV